MIDLSVRLGRTVMTASQPLAHLRDLLVLGAMRTGPGRRYFTEMRFRPDTRVRTGAVVRPDGRAHPLVGSLLPQPQVLYGPDYRATLLDDILGTGWSLLGAGVDEADWTPVEQAGLPHSTRIEVVLADRALGRKTVRPEIADADGRLQALFQDLAGHFVLVRPDRMVAAVFTSRQAAQVGRHFRRFAFSAREDSAAAGTHTPTDTSNQGAAA